MSLPVSAYRIKKFWICWLQCGAAKKSPSTVLEEGELNALFDRITKTHSVENFDKFYALRSISLRARRRSRKGEEAPVRR